LFALLVSSSFRCRRPCRRYHRGQRSRLPVFLRQGGTETLCPTRPWFHSNRHSHLNNMSQAVPVAASKAVLVARAHTCALTPRHAPIPILRRKQIPETGTRAKPANQSEVAIGPVPNHCIGHEPKRKMNEKAATVPPTTFSFVGVFILSSCRTLPFRFGELASRNLRRRVGSVYPFVISNESLHQLQSGPSRGTAPNERWRRR